MLSLVERDVPAPGPGQVRVRMIRAGVNPTDWKRRLNPMEHPEITPGQDGAGVVDAVGAGVGDLVVGDRVWVMLAQRDGPYGTAAEYTVQDAARVIGLPEEASFDLGASLGVPAITAHRALTSTEFGPTRLGPDTMNGMTVLVAGGAGAVGNAAIQLARWSGATVVTTVSSPEKAALAAAAGAHHVVNYRAVDVATAITEVAPDGVDLVVEVSPSRNNPLDLAVTKVHATVAIYANNGGDEVTLPLRATFSKNLRYQFLILYSLHEPLLRAAAEDVNAAVAAGAFNVGEEAGIQLHHFGLEQTAAAHDAVEGGLVGKALLDIAEE